MPDELLIAVEFDVFSVSALGVVTLRLCSRGPLTYTDPSAGLVQYVPLLFEPIALGTSAVTVTSGLPVRAQPNGGLIEFGLDEDLTWDWVGANYFWPGRVFRVYQGNSTSGNRADLALVYTGRIADLAHDTIKASVKTTDVGLELDKALVTDLFADTYPEAIRGRPRPKLWGRAISIAPVLVDQANLIYEVSYDPGGTQELQEITEVRVGGVAWAKVTSSPAQGQWAPVTSFSLPGDPHFSAGLQLGSVTEGLEVRCDANAFGWETLTTPNLVAEIAAIGGVSIDVAAFVDWQVNGCGDPVGYYTTTESVNIADALDEIVGANASFWGFQPDGTMFGAALKPPATTADLTIDEIEIDAAEVPEQLPSAWRIRIEYARNWSPDTNPASGLTEQEKAALAAPGIAFEPHYEDLPTKEAQKRAVDAPLVRSLFWRYNGAWELNQRLQLIWGTRYVPLATINVSAWIDADDIDLFATIAITYKMLTGNYRLLSATRAIGGAPAQLQLWGPAIPTSVPASSGIRGEVILVTGDWVIPAADIKLTLLGAGGGASGTSGGSATIPPTIQPGGGGSGGVAIKWFTGLTIGHTLAMTVGSAGRGGGFGRADGEDGTDTIAASGTETISTITTHAGEAPPADTSTAGFGGGLGSGGDVNGIGNGGNLSPGGGVPSLRLGNYGWGGFPGFNYYRGFNAGSGGPGLIIAEWDDSPVPCAIRGQPFVVAGSYSFIIPSTNLKITFIGAGGGGRTPNGGGGSGAAGIKWLRGLTVGQTLMLTVGLHGAANTDGAATIVASGTGSILTLTAPGGHTPPGDLSTAGFGGAISTNGDINAVGNGGSLGNAGGVPSCTIGNAGWGAQAGVDLYGNGTSAGADGAIIMEWTE